MPEGRVVACLANAEAAMRDAFDAIPLNTVVWGDQEESITDAAYGHVEEIRRWLDAIEQRLMG
jgi:hypothetical protein